MATFDEQVMQAWDEWESSTGAEANNPDDFVAWAIRNRRIIPRPQDMHKIVRRQVTGVLRRAIRTDEFGITYRAKQCVMISENGTQIAIWFDIDRNGTPNLRKKAVHQRREGIANSVYRAICDVKHMQHVFPEEQLTFFPDFTDDMADRDAAAALERDQEDDEDDAAEG